MVLFGVFTSKSVSRFWNHKCGRPHRLLAWNHKRGHPPFFFRILYLLSEISIYLLSQISDSWFYCILFLFLFNDHCDLVCIDSSNPEFS